ncbi:MAG: hypothetical protein IJZ75_04490 [Clostridia bacterium]|nr:hypothetical protein [Clostridia bacterium]
MKCEKCGFEYDEAIGACPNCKGEFLEPVSVNPAADKVLNLLKDGLFLVICIIVSVSCLASLSTGGMPLLQILMAVFLWLAFAQGRKNIADSSQLRNVSGTIYANYVLVNVAVICVIVSGALFGLAWQFITDASMAQELIDEIISTVGIENTYMVETLFNISGTLVAGIIAAVGVVGLLINVLGFRKIHRLAKSTYISVDTCVPNFENARGAKNWMIAFAVFELVSAASGLFLWQVNSAVTGACSGVCLILGSILVDKYLISENV